MISSIKRLFVGYVIIMMLSIPCVNAQEKEEIFVDVQFLSVGSRHTIEGGIMKGTTIFYKVKKQYIALGSNLNTLGAPVRIPVMTVTVPIPPDKLDISKQLKFYTRSTDAEGEFIYRPFHTHTWSLGQKNLLFVLTKVKELKVDTHDLTPILSKKTGLVIINANQEKGFKVISGKKSGILAPHEKLYLSGDGGAVKVSFSAVVKEKTLVPLVKTFEVKPDQIPVIFVYPVKAKEDFREVKFVRHKVGLGYYRKPRYVDE